MKISIERTKTAASGNAMHWMGNSFLCSEYMKMKKRQLGLWFSDFGGEATSLKVDSMPKQNPATLPCPPWLPVVDAGVGIVALGYMGMLVLHILNVF